MRGRLVHPGDQRDLADLHGGGVEVANGLPRQEGVFLAPGRHLGDP